jgi:hypothetical protein
MKIGKCPIDKDCVVIENSSNTCFCVYMRGYPDISEGNEAGLTTLACVHLRAPAHSEVTSLIAYARGIHMLALMVELNANTLRMP